MAKKRVRYKPLYEQVKELLLEQILEGEFQPGEAIPSESILAENFETSVSTVRQAVSLLVGDGVLVKQQGKRTCVSEQKTSLKFLTWIPETKLGEQIILEVIDRFEKQNPSLKIECIPTTYHIAQKELVKLISSGNAPDVAQITSHWTSFFASMGALERLEPLLADDNFINRAYEKDLVGGMYRNKFYSVAWGISPISLFVNKNVVQSAGMHVIDSPMTLDGFLETCRKLDRFYHGQDVYSYGMSVLNEESDFLLLYTFLQAFGGKFTNDQGEIVLHSAENVEGFRWLRNFVNQCHIFQSDIPTLRSRFAKGEIAFLSDGAWSKYILEELTGEDFDKNFAVVLNPVQRDCNSYSWNYNHALSICSQSRHTLHAAKFIDTLTNDPELSNYYYSRVGFLPVNRQFMESPQYSSAYYQTFKQQLVHSSCINAQHKMFEKAMDFCVDAVKKILFEEGDIDRELEEKEYYLNILYS